MELPSSEPEVHVGAASLRPVSLVDALISRLRSQILSGRLSVGDLVTEGYCADEFGVSRVTAQKAISHMVARTLLTQDFNKPAKVPAISAEDVRDLFRVRIPIEVEALRMTIRRADDRGQQSLIDVADSLASFQGSDLAVFSDRDLYFHRTLVELSASPRLLRSWETIEWELQLAMIQAARPIDAVHVACEHQRIAQSLSASNQINGQNLLSEHLKAAREELATLLT